MSEIQIALTPVHLGLFFGGLACVFAFFLRRQREGIRMARYLVENQHRAASDAELDTYQTAPKCSIHNSPVAQQH